MKNRTEVGEREESRDSIHDRSVVREFHEGDRGIEGSARVIGAKERGRGRIIGRIEASDAAWRISRIECAEDIIE